MWFVFRAKPEKRTISSPSRERSERELSNYKLSILLLFKSTAKMKASIS
ncbi:MAG: hypothetical protein U5L45_09735 [Saprospiraceae bacterium]|nr:hypothetical protein [Saprospiraceae bacterium]